ncbi:MAG: hypothetical protein U1F43_30930 [Myxococcota bacterium]
MQFGFTVPEGTTQVTLALDIASGGFGGGGGQPLDIDAVLKHGGDPVFYTYGVGAGTAHHDGERTALRSATRRSSSRTPTAAARGRATRPPTRPAAARLPASARLRGHPRADDILGQVLDFRRWPSLPGGPAGDRASSTDSPTRRPTRRSITPRMGSKQSSSVRPSRRSARHHTTALPMPCLETVVTSLATGCGSPGR